MGASCIHWEEGEGAEHLGEEVGRGYSAARGGVQGYGMPRAQEQAQTQGGCWLNRAARDSCSGPEERPHRDKQTEDGQGVPGEELWLVLKSGGPSREGQESALGWRLACMLSEFGKNWV